MSVESFTDEQAGELFEELFLHYKKDFISEKEMLSFFKTRGFEIKDRKKLALLMFKAERALHWITAGVGPDWTPAIFAKSSHDFEKYLEKKQERKIKKKKLGTT